MHFLEINPGDDLFVNISFIDLTQTFRVTIIPSQGELFEFELDTDNAYAVLAKASINGPMAITYAGFIPLGKYDRSEAPAARYLLTIGWLSLFGLPQIPHPLSHWTQSSTGLVHRDGDCLARNMAHKSKSLFAEKVESMWSPENGYFAWSVCATYLIVTFNFVTIFGFFSFFSGIQASHLTMSGDL